MDKYLSKKEYLNKYDSNVGYALYVQNNIKKDDYVRLNTGEIVKVIGIKENKLNKKAIYFGIYEQDWFDNMAVENFSDKPIDLIEVGDIINKELVTGIIDIINDKEEKVGRKLITQYRSAQFTGLDIKHYIYANGIKTILTKESYMANCYKVGGEDETSND